VIADAFSWLALLGGSYFVLAGGVGLVRLPDLYTRMHAAGLVDTMGMVLVFAGLMLQAGLAHATIKLFVIAFFTFFTSPTTTHALAKAARHGGVEPRLPGEPAASNT